MGDASLGINAFLGFGKQDEARAFMAWLLSAPRLDRPRLPVLLTLHGKHPRAELQGRRDAQPPLADAAHAFCQILLRDHKAARSRNLIP